MKSLLAALLSRHKAEEVIPDIKSMQDGVGDLRAAMGISHMPEDKPVIYFLFQNSDEGPHARYWETAPDNGPTSALNEVSRRGLTHPSSCSAESFDQQHYLEMASENTRPTMPANRAMAFSIANHRKFEQMALRAGRAFMADAEFAGDLSLTLVYVPPLDPTAKWPLQPPYQVTFTPNLNPIMPTAVAEPEQKSAVSGAEHRAIVGAISAIKQAMRHS